MMLFWHLNVSFHFFNSAPDAVDCLILFSSETSVLPVIRSLSVVVMIARYFPTLTDGGARNFGGGIVDCELVNPLYEEHELRRVFDRGKGNTDKMDDKDEQWREEYLSEFKSELAERVGDGP